MFKHCFLLVSLLFIFQHLAFAVHDQYTVHVLAFQVSKGPKRKNCSVVTLKTLNKNTVHFDIRVNQNVTLEYGRVTASSADDRKLVLPFQMKKPCDHYVVKQAIVMFLKVTHDCVLLKNDYVYSMNLEEFALSYPYLREITRGDWNYQIALYGKNCNVLCFYLRLNITDRPTP